MTTIRFKSCKIGVSIPLEKPRSFFRLQKSSVWKEYITLQEHHLVDILKKPCESMAAYLFEFGCITFVNFEEPDIQVFLEFIAGMVETIDYSMVARFSETHAIEVLSAGEFRPWPESPRTFRYEDSVISLIAVILAKSAALNKIELDVDDNIDESGKYIEYLRRGRLRVNKKTLSLVISNFVKFEYELINNIRIFDRSLADTVSINAKEANDAVAEYFEINDRFAVLQSKIDSLRGTMKAYNSLSYRQSENRLYVFEIFLLGLFPLMGLIRMYLHH